MHPLLAQYLAPFAPANSEVHDIALEAARVAADVEYNRRKNSGELLRRDSDRALLEQIQHEDAQ